MKFEILESLKHRGGNHFCYFYANSINEVIQALNDAWYKSGINRYGGELFLIAVLYDAEDNEIELFLGNCNFGKRDQFCFNVQDIYTDEEFDPWFSCGIFERETQNPFRELLKALFDYDNPSRVLGSYLFKLSKQIEKLPSNKQVDFSLHIVANILEFGKSQDKLLELNRWIFSRKGNNFLSSDVDMDRPELIALKKSNSAEVLEAFIEQYKKDFGFKIYLPSKT